MILGKYRLKKDLPNLNKGVIFEHRLWDPQKPDIGNPGCGCLILGWINGNCQGGWCGDTFIFPGQLADNTEWFTKISGNESEKEEILAQIEDLKKKVARL